MLEDLITNFSANVASMATLISGLAVIVGGVYAIYKFLIPGFKAIQRSFTQMEQISEIADTVLAEFRPNGGSSMKDALNRVEKQIGRIETELVDVKKEARTMGARQWALVATQKDPVFETDSAGNCLRINTQFSNLVERGFEEVKGNGWENIICTDDKDRVIREWTQAIDRERAFESVFGVCGSITKRRHQVKCVAMPYYDHEGAILGYIGRYVDIA